MARLPLLLLFLAVVAQGHWWMRAGIRRNAGEGFALRFNEKNPKTQFVEFTRPITFGSPSGLTFEFQVKPRSVLFPQQPILDFRDSAGNIVSVTVDLLYRIAVTVKRVGRNPTTVYSNLLGVMLDKWNYVIVTVDRNGVVRFYREDDKRVLGFGSGTLSYPVPTFTATTNSAGRFGGSGVDFFIGDLDDIRIWTTVLPSSEFDRYRIIDLSPNSYADLLLLHWWPLDEGIGATVYDATKNANTGILGAGDVPRFPDWIFANPLATDSCRTIQTRSSFTVKTFDKASRDNWAGVGEYWFALSPVERDGGHAIAVQVKLDRTTVSPTSVIGVAFDYYGDSIWLDFDFADNNYASVLKIREVGDSSYRTVELDSLLLSSGITIVRDGPKANKHTFIIEVPFSLSLKADVDPRSSAQKVEIEVKIPRDDFLSRSPDFMVGLCGNYNGISNDDVIDASARVLPQDSLFTGQYNYYNYTGPSNFDCDVSILSQSIRNQAYNVCRDSGLVDSDYTAACLREVCTTGEIESAVPFARATYRECVQTFTNQLNATTNPCPRVCPNFCNFQGTCKQDGTCACFGGFGGVDCSQKASFPCYQARWSNSNAKKTLRPFVGNPNTNIVSHYSYGNPYASSANTDNEISESVVLYLYQQPNAQNVSRFSLGLVMLADKAQDGTEGALRVTAYFTNASSAAIAVRDDPPGNDHYYSLSNGIFSGDWKWWKCCTDGVAFSGLPTAGPFCVRFNFTKIEGIKQIVVAEQNQFGSQDLFGVDTSLSVSPTSQLSICGDTCQNPCGLYSDCFNCTARAECGWCADSNTCEFGTASGPDSGRCATWRYSNQQNVSRFLTSDVNYPVDPSDVTAYIAPNNPLDVSFWVNFPLPSDVPLEVVLLQDVSSAFLALGAVKAQTVFIYTQIQRTFIRAKLGISSFSDSPAFGTSVDVAYKTNLPLSTEKGAIQDALNSLQLLNGGAAPNSQFEALSRVSTATDVRWTTDARKVVILLTFTPARVDSTYTSTKVRNDLLAANIIPVFLAPATVVSQYTNLVNSWGFGYARTISTSDFSTIFSEISTIFDTIGGSAKAVLQTPGQVASITPASGYFGLSPLTRVAFTVRLTSAGSGDAVVVVPGYGKLTIRPGQAENPSTPASQTVVLNAANGLSVDIQLQGSSSQNTPLNVVITKLPLQGSLFQLGGTRINAVPTTVADPGLRVTYVAPSGANGSPYTSFEYKLQDSCGACSVPTSVVINVIGTFPRPVAVPNPSSLTLAEDTTRAVVLNGTGTITFAKVTRLPTQGQLLYNSVPVTLTTQISSPFGVTYSPSANFFGSDWFGFVVGSSVATSLEVSVPIVVTPVNDAPTANPQSVTTPEDTPITITLSGTPGPFETEPITFQISTPPTSGSLARLSEGVYRFQPAPYWNGITSFTFYTNDGQANSPIAAVVITVTPVTNQPIVTNQQIIVDQGVATTLNISGTDVDSPGAQVVTFICAWNGRGTLKLTNGTVIPTGSTNITLINNQVVYQSPLNEFGASFTSFTYGVKKAVGGLSSDCATISIWVNQVPYPPVPSTPQVVSLLQGTTVSVTLVGSDANTDLLRFIICNAPGRGTLTQVGGAALAGGGVVATTVQTGPTTQATLNYFVATAGADSFSFLVSDGFTNSSCVPVTVNASSVNRPPVATSPPLTTLLEDSAGTLITLGGSDPDGDAITFQVTFLPSKGVLYQTSGGNPTTPVVVNTQTTQVVFYVPTPLTFGSDSFLFVTNDGSVFSSSASASISITHVNHRPTADPRTFTFPEDTYVEFNLTATDVDAGDTVNFFIVSGPSRGTLTAPTSPFGSAAVLRYTPPANENNQYPTPANPFTSFTFVASDGLLNSTVTTVTFNVQPVNDAPVATPASSNVTTIQNTPIQLKLSGSDIDGDSLTITLTSLPKGKLYQSLAEGQTTTYGPEITVGSVIPNTPEGRVVYVPGTLDNTAPYVIIQYTVSDGQASDSASVSVYLQQLPQGLTTSASGNEDEGVNITLQSSYPTGNTFIITELLEGTITLSDGTPVNVNDPLPATGNSLDIVYTGPQYGNGVKNFKYVVVNGAQTSLPTTVSVTLTAVPSPLLITQTTLVVDEDFNGLVYLPVFDPDNSPTTTVTILGLPQFIQIVNVDEQNATTSAITSSNRDVTNRSWMVRFLCDPNAFGQTNVLLSVQDAGRTGVVRSVTVVIQSVNEITTPLTTTYLATDADPVIPITLAWTNPDNFGGFLEPQLVKFVNVPAPSKGLLQVLSGSSWVTINNGDLFAATIPDALILQFVPQPRVCSETGTPPPCATGLAYGPFGDALDEFFFTNFTWTICDDRDLDGVCDTATESAQQTNEIDITRSFKAPVPQQVYASDTLTVYTVGTAIQFTLQASLPDCLFLIASGASSTDIDTCHSNARFLVAGTGLPASSQGVSTQAGNTPFVNSASGSTFRLAPTTTLTASNGVATQTLFYRSSGIEETLTLQYRARMADTGATSSTFFLTIVIQENNAPTISAQNQAGHSLGGIITTAVVSDDATSSQQIRVLVYLDTQEKGKAVKVALGDDSGLDSPTYTLNDAPLYGFTLISTVQIVNQLLGPGRGIYYPPMAKRGSNIIIFVDDMGSGLTPADITKAKNTTKTILLDDTAFNTFGFTGVGVAGLVGVTTITSMGTYGVFQLLKKKKLIPEEADPWENDQLWDATLDNPLFPDGKGEAIY